VNEADVRVRLREVAKELPVCAGDVFGKEAERVDMSQLSIAPDCAADIAVLHKRVAAA